MKILIIEDDPNKLDNVKKFVKKILISKSKSPKFCVRQSYQSGLSEIYDNQYDLLILDMSIPNFDITNFDDGGDPIGRGGELILREMYRDQIMIKTIIVTQYEEFDGESLSSIDKSLKEEFDGFYLGCVFYSVIESTWKDDFKKIIMKEVLC